MSVSPARPATAALARGALLVLAFHFATAGLLRPLLRPYAYSDFATFYSAARCFAEHRDPYDFGALDATGKQSFEGWIGRYFYPPPFAACALRPLVLLPFGVARRLWVLVEAAAYVAAALLLVRGLFGRRDAVGLALVGFLFLPFAPVYLDFKLGSVSGLLLLLVVVFLRQRRAGHAWRAALVLAAAALLKLTPALVVLYLALRGDWRFLLRTCACGAALLALSLPGTGVQAYAVYVQRVLPFLASADFSWFTNQSADAFFWRLFVPGDNTTPWITSPLLYRLGTWGLGAAVLAGLVALGVRARRTALARAEEEWWEIAAVLVASLVLSRVSWEYMLVLALPCFALWLRDAARGRATDREVLAVATAFALCALPFPYAEAPLHTGLGILLEAPRFYGLLLLLGTTLVRLLCRAPVAAEQ